MTYTPTQFDTAEQKLKFEKKFKRFIQSDFNPTLFPKWFYNRLSNTFGHIAHYNLNGFYETWFACTTNRLEWLEYIAKGGAYGCCGDPAFTYSDVERVLAEWVRESGFIEKYQKKLSGETETYERNLLTALEIKYKGASA